MKKKIAIFILVCFAVVPALANKAQTEQKLGKIRQYINLLDHKISVARKNKNQKRLGVLKKLKKQQLERAQKVRQASKKEPVKKTPKSKTATPVRSQIGKKKVWRVGTGLAAGALMVDVGRVVSDDGALKVIPELGIGLGNGYSVVKGHVAWQKGPLGLEIGLASYSKRVKNIIPLNGSVGSGLRYCLGIYYLFEVSDWQAKLGLNNGLGLVFSLRQAF